MKDTSNEVLVIQYLRGFAACAVTINHMGFMTGGATFPAGAAGVDIFFVISGFIMWVTTTGKPTTPQKFIVRRITRIVPLYWIVTVLTAVAILAKPNFYPAIQITWHDFIGSLLFAPIAKNGSMPTVVRQGWSLVYEMFFYLVFAAGLFAPAKFRFPFVVAVLGVLVVFRQLLSDGPLYVLGDPIVLEFAGGMLLGHLWMNSPDAPVWLGGTIAVTGALLLLIFQIAIPEDVTRLIRWGVPALVLVAGAILIERARAPWVIRSLKLLGDASYSIYLWHGLVGNVMLVAFIQLAPLHSLYTITCVAFTIVGSVVLYFLIEKRLADWFHAARPRQARQQENGPEKFLQGLRQKPNSVA